MSQSTPAIVTLVSQLSGQQRPLPQQDGRITRSELQSLTVRLRQLITLTAHLAESVDQIRARALLEQAASSASVQPVSPEHIPTPIK